MSLSIIVCCTKPHLAEELKRNISDTIGKDARYEIIAIDNTISPRPLAKVYNEGGRCARYENLLFIHQDAGFISHDWLRTIEKKLSEPDCGVIGFAGTKVMHNLPGGWEMDPEWSVISLIQCGRPERLNHTPEIPFAEVVALDGYLMFVRKDVWQECPFDEKLLTGFHCYDMDFSMSVALKYKNYACNILDTFHNSQGNYDSEWQRQILKMYTDKWSRFLPLAASDVKLRPSDFARLEERACFRMLKKFAKAGGASPYLERRFFRYPPTPRHIEHLFKHLLSKAKSRLQPHGRTAKS